MIFIIHQHLPGLAAFAGAYNAGGFQLIHDASRPVVTYGEFALNQRGGTLLVNYDQAGGIFEERIAQAEVNIAQAATAILIDVLG